MVKQGTPEWFAMRKGRVTGSNVGAILGLDPNRKRADVLRAMVRDFHGVQTEFTGNVATDYGKAMEEDARFDYELTTGNEVREASFVMFEDWLGASPDGFIGNDGVFEAKCPFGKRKLESGEDFKSIEEQPHYYAQMQIEMFCCNCSWAAFWQWAPNANRLMIIEYDAEWIAKNVPLLRAFYEEYLEAIREPGEALEDLRVTIDTATSRRLIKAYRKAQADMDKAEAMKKELLAQVVALTGGKNAIVSGARLTKVNKEGSISYATAVKELLPGVKLDKYKGKPSSFWKLS